MPKVSVIMSVYNDEKFVAQSIEGVLNSTYTDFEFIICNDCSTDGSSEIIKKYKDKRIIFFSNGQNQGLAKSLNNCIERAKSEYIMRIDSDDICLPDRMEKQVAYLDEHKDIAMCGTFAQVIDNSNNNVYILQRPIDVTVKDIFKNNSFIHPSVMIRKEILDSVGCYVSKKETRRAEDFDLWCRIYEAGFKGKNISEILINYREDFSSYKKRKFRYRVDVYKLMKQWRKKLGLPLRYKFYAFKILLVGLIPKNLLYKMKKGKSK